MERKLAAILAADVVGYSALMERDEAGTFDRLRAGRKELFEPEINKHHGRIFKLMGDGLLAEFGSVVDAVECAVTLQRGMVERNASVPEGERIEVRIGINLGEVIVEGEDRYGEGVNIAARLQQLADPGGICVSGKVSKEVEKKLAFAFEPMGEQRMKNIAEPVDCYRVKLDNSPRRIVSRQRPSAIWLSVAALGAVGIIAGSWFAVLWQNAPPRPAPSSPGLPVAVPSDDLGTNKSPTKPSSAVPGSEPRERNEAEVIDQFTPISPDSRWLIGTEFGGTCVIFTKASPAGSAAKQDGVDVPQISFRRSISESGDFLTLDFGDQDRYDDSRPIYLTAQGQRIRMQFRGGKVTPVWTGNGFSTAPLKALSQWPKATISGVSRTGETYDVTYSTKGFVEAFQWMNRECAKGGLDIWLR